MLLAMRAPKERIGDDGWPSTPECIREVPHVALPIGNTVDEARVLGNFGVPATPSSFLTILLGTSFSLGLPRRMLDSLGKVAVILT